MNSPAHTRPSLAEEAPHEPTSFHTKHNMLIELPSDVFPKMLLVPQEHEIRYNTGVVMVPETPIRHSNHRSGGAREMFPTHVYCWVQTSRIAAENDIRRNSLEQHNLCRCLANQLGKYLNCNL